MKRVLLFAILGFFSAVLIRTLLKRGATPRRNYGTQDRQTWPFSI